MLCGYTPSASRVLLAERRDTGCLAHRVYTRSLQLSSNPRWRVSTVAPSTCVCGCSRRSRAPTRRARKGAPRCLTDRTGHSEIKRRKPARRRLRARQRHRQGALDGGIELAAEKPRANRRASRLPVPTSRVRSDGRSGCRSHRRAATATRTLTPHGHDHFFSLLPFGFAPGSGMSGLNPGLAPLSV